MKLREIIYNIKDSLGTDAEELTNAQYKFIIDYYRSKLIRQRIQKGQKLASSLTQALHNLSIDLIGDVDPNCGHLDKCTYTTDDTIPGIIPYSEITTLQYVGGTDGYLAYQETAYQALAFEQFAKYIKTQPKWFLFGDKLYIINPPDEQIEAITIQGVFEDPLAAASICPDFNADCIRNYDFEYPIPADMLDTIYKLVRDNELRGLIQEIDEDEKVAR